MKDLMMNEEFSDVTLVTEDKKHIMANINILSACSPVFQGIFKKEKKSRIMYLRGIQYSEMESIMQFIYLGEATFYEERMEEFLAVAKSLEIKKLCNAETDDDPMDENLPSDQEASNENLEEKSVVSDPSRTIVLHEMPREVFSVNVDGKYECDQCHKAYSSKGGLKMHKESAHEGVKYPCNQCDYQATQKVYRAKHIQSKHEGVRYDCHQCEKSFTSKSKLTKHFQAKHEGVKYGCDYCDFRTSHQDYLRAHMKNNKNKHEASRSKYEGLKYACDYCDSRTSMESCLRTHIKNKHNNVVLL